MDKLTAQRLVRNTLKAPFDRKRYHGLVNELCNGFDDAKARNMTVPDAFAAHVKSCQRLGTFTSLEEELADVLVVHLTESWKLERSRTALRDFVAHKLKRGEGSDSAYKEAGLIAFVAPVSQSWRFSYVRMDYATKRDPQTGKIKTEERLTPARRYSYLVGAEEECHTAQTRFLALLQNTAAKPTLAQIEEAFSVESVTKEFFNEYARLFKAMDEALTAVVARHPAIRADFAAKGISTVDFAKKLLGQIVFLYFIQKKGWLGVGRGMSWGEGPRHFLRQLADQAVAQGQCLFNEVLEPLFYDTLATDRGAEAWCPRFQCRIPFLNGGLFEPLAGYDWEQRAIALPNALFTNRQSTPSGDIGTGILDVFDRYNFTVNEAEPLEKEVAIDPEMLGKVFENLIEENRRKGLGAFYTPREIVHYMCQESLINYLDTTVNLPNRMMERTDIEALIREGEQAAHYETARKDGTVSYQRRLPKAIEENARSLDEALRSITVCDPAIGSGAFPVGMMTEIVRARMALTPYFDDATERTAYHFKRHAIQNSLYGVDIDIGAVEIAKLRLWLSLVVDEEDVQQIKPLPNLDYKVVAGNSLLGVEKNLFNDEYFKQLEALKPKFFDESNRVKRADFKQQIDNLIHKLTKGREVFDFEIYFSEVLHCGGGFDIVIANPPYVGEKGNKNLFAPLRQSALGVRFGQGKMDLFYYFIHLSLDLLRRCGCAAFITTNYYVTATGACKLIQDLQSRSTILSLINLGELKVFESALGQHNMISIFQKEMIDRTAHTIVTKRQGFLNPSTFNHIVSGKDSETIYTTLPQKFLYADGKMQLTHDRCDCLFDSIKSKYQQLGSVVIISQGLQSGLDECFILDKAHGLYNSRHAKPYFKNSDIYAYGYRGTQRKILYVDNSNKTELTSTPEISRYLLDFKSKLQCRAQIVRSNQSWYSMLWPRKREYFEREKVVCSYRAKNNEFAIVDGEWFCGTDVYMIMPVDGRYSNKMIGGILNSRLIGVWLNKRGAKKGQMLELTKDHLSNIPLPTAVPLNICRSVEMAVEKIIVQKKIDPSADTSALEREIDQLVYVLYGLTPEEIQIVESAAR